MVSVAQVATLPKKTLNKDQDTDLGNKPPVTPSPSEPKGSNNLLESFPELRRTFPNNAYQLAESFTPTEQSSPHERSRLLQRINTSLATGELTAEVAAEFSYLDVSQPQIPMAAGDES